MRREQVGWRGRLNGAGGHGPRPLDGPRQAKSSRPAETEQLLAGLMDDVTDARRQGDTAKVTRLVRQIRDVHDAMQVLAGAQDDQRPRARRSAEEIVARIALLEGAGRKKSVQDEVRAHCVENGLELRRMDTGEVVFRPNGEE